MRKRAPRSDAALVLTPHVPQRAALVRGSRRRLRRGVGAARAFSQATTARFPLETVALPAALSSGDGAVGRAWGNAVAGGEVDNRGQGVAGLQGSAGDRAL